MSRDLDDTIKFINRFYGIFTNNEVESHESYMKNLPKYKEMMYKTPNKFLQFHLDDSLKKGRYELAQHIKEVAEERNFKLL